MTSPNSTPREQTILVVDDQPIVTDAVAAVLAGPGHTVITASDCQSGAAVIERVPLSWVISEIHFNTPFECQGFQLLESALRASPDCRVVMLTSDSSPSIMEEALRRGAFAVLHKQQGLKALPAVLGVPRGQPDGGRVYRLPDLGTIIRRQMLVPKFQPIFELGEDGGSPFGYESLIRFTGDATFADPMFLFDYARRKEAIVEFDLACMKRSLECGAALSRTGKLFINVHPQLFAQCHRLNQLLKDCAMQFDIPLENVVLEITEQEILAAEEPAIRCAAELKRMGLQFALDDVGMSYSHLNLIGAIGPSYLKISHSFGATLHTNPTHEKIIRNIIALATDFDCRVIVEGIEEMATMTAALRVGAQLGQGYFFAEPREVVDFDSTAKRQVQWHAQPMERDHAAR